MRNRVYFTLLFALTCLDCFSQSNTANGLGYDTFMRVVNQQFSTLVTGQSRSSIGNFAAIDLAKSEVSFAASHIAQRGYVFTLKAAGGVTDGLFPIFTNSTLNSNISLEGQANFLNRRNLSLSWYDDSYVEYQDKLYALEENYRRKSIDKEYKADSINLVYKRNSISQKIIQLEKRLTEETDNLTRDSIQYGIRMLQSDVQVINDLISSLPNKISAMEDLNNWRAKELKKIKLDLEIYAFKFKWLSAYYKIGKNGFKLFSPAEEFYVQVLDTSFVSHELRIQFNKYLWTKEKFKTYFYCIGVGISRTDNFNLLSKEEIVEVSSHGTDSTNSYERATTKKYNAYSGDYIRDIVQLRLYGDYYRFLFGQNAAALHVFPEVILRSDSEPIYNLGFGFLLAFKDDKKDGKSIVNAEVYYNLTDLADHTNTQLPLLKRNNIGFRFAFPINFVNK